MFSRSSRTSKESGAAASPAAAAKPAPPSIVSKDLRITGDLNCDGEIQVDGIVAGDVRATILLVGETAEIKGEITADTVMVHGKVTGQIKARSVQLAKTATMVGDILHEDLSIEAGAFLEGHCKRLASVKEDVKGRIDVVGKEPEPALVAPKTSAPGAIAIAPALAVAAPKPGLTTAIYPPRDDEKKVTVGGS